MVIGLTGPKLSGKGTAAKYLTEKYGAKVYGMSGILTDIARRLHLENSRANLIAIVTGLRSQFGADILAKTLYQDVLEAKDALAVIDGIRMTDEVKIFSTLPGFILVYVDAPLQVRYERAKNRGEKVGESTMTFEEFKKEEAAQTEVQIQGLREQAHDILNQADLDSFYAQLDRIAHQ
jgi:dephospho-CoA kinase